MKETDGVVCYPKMGRSTVEPPGMLPPYLSSKADGTATAQGDSPISSVEVGNATSAVRHRESDALHLRKPFAISSRLAAGLTGLCAWLSLPMAGCAPDAGSTDTGSQRNSALYVDPQDLDLGKVSYTPSHVAEITIRNESSSDIDVLLEGSCDCTSISPSEFPLAAHGEKVVALTVDLTTVEPELLALRERDFTVQVLARTGAKTNPAVWKLKARVLQPFRVTPPLLRCDVVTGMPVKASYAEIQGGESLERLAVECDCEEAVANVEPIPGKPGEFKLIVTPSGSTLLPEIARCGVRLHGQLEGGKPVEMTVPVVVEATDHVFASPSINHLGTIARGEWAEETVTVASSFGIPFAVSETKIVNGTAEVLQIDDHDSADSHSYLIKVRADDAGNKSATIDFTIGEKDEGLSSRASDKRNLKVELFYFGE